MTVKELISKLENIQNKDQAVCIPYKTTYAPIEIDDIIPINEEPVYHITDSNGEGTEKIINRGYSYNKYILIR